VNRESRQWQQLTVSLGTSDFTTAYVTSGTDAAAEFGYQTKTRAMVETAGARIGLAVTDLVLDGSGAYRAVMTLHVDNRTEPYLEIELPENAAIWTAHVDDLPVKPARALGSAGDRLLRVPLIKTAEGELDFKVVLKYAGKLDRLAPLRSVRFPVLQTKNIAIELSQVKLYLPETHQWVDFAGTAARVDDEEGLQAGIVGYETRQVEKLTEIMRGSNEFSKSRAIANFRILEGKLQGLQQRARGGRQAVNEELRQNLESNAQVLQAATEEIEQQRGKQQVVPDNRSRMNMFYQQQRNENPGNSATRLGYNFGLRSQAPESGKPAEVQSLQRFDENWFDGKGAEGRKELKDEAAAQDQQPPKKSKKRIGSSWFQRGQQELAAPEAQNAAQKVFSQSGQSGQVAQQQMPQQRAGGKTLDTQEDLNRAYADKLGRQVTAGESVVPAQPAGEVQMALEGANTPAEAAFDAEVGRAGLSSLDFDLPTRGAVHYFTTPRGDVVITARPVDRRIVERLVNLGWLAGIAVGLLVILAVSRRVARSGRGLVVGAVVFWCVGLLSILFTALPVYGLVLIAGGVLLIVESRRRRSAAAPA